MATNGSRKYCSVFGCLNNSANPALSFFSIPTKGERASSNNPFDTDEEVLTQTTSEVASGTKPKVTRAKKSPAQKKIEKIVHSESDSEDEEPPAKKKKLCKPKLFLDSEDNETDEPIRASALRNFLSRRTASGNTLQSNRSATGEYYVELRVFYTKELEAVANDTTRWKKAFITFKGAIDDTSPIFKSVSDVVTAAKKEYKGIQPVLYPSNTF